MVTGQYLLKLLYLLIVPSQEMSLYQLLCWIHHSQHTNKHEILHKTLYNYTVWLYNAFLQWRQDNLWLNQKDCKSCITLNLIFAEVKEKKKRMKSMKYILNITNQWEHFSVLYLNFLNILILHSRWTSIRKTLRTNVITWWLLVILICVCIYLA